NGFLDLQGSVFRYRQPRISQSAQSGTACLSKQQCRGWVDVDEDFFNGCCIGAGLLDNVANVVEYLSQAFGQCQLSRHHNSAAGDVGQARPAGLHDTKASASQAWINAKYSHQCLKWRTPVNTMAISRSLAAAMTSSSRMLPPG